jgi:hypothetical protein
MIQKKLGGLLDMVLNPQGQPVPRRRPDSVFVKAPGNKGEKTEDQPSYDLEPLALASRLDTLDGKTVYLVDGKFGGGYSFLVEMQDWFSTNMPAVKTVLRRKAGNMFMDDPDLWAEIKEKGDAVVLGVGG